MAKESTVNMNNAMPFSYKCRKPEANEEEGRWEGLRHRYCYIRQELEEFCYCKAERLQITTMLSVQSKSLKKGLKIIT